MVLEQRQACLKVFLPVLLVDVEGDDAKVVRGCDFDHVRHSRARVMLSYELAEGLAELREYLHVALAKLGEGRVG